MIKAYCMKERKKGVDMVDPRYQKNANGSYMARGTCKSCGGTVITAIGFDKIPKGVTIHAAKPKAKKGGSAKSRKSKKAPKTKSRASRKSRK